MLLNQLIDIFTVLLPAWYAAVVSAYGVFFFRDNALAGRLGRRMLLAGIALHVIYIAARTAAFDHPPITTVFEILTMLAACIAIAYAYIEFRTQTMTTGFFILILAFLFQTASSLFIRDLGTIPEILRSRLLGFHVSTALLGYTGISLSAVYGALYLMLYHEIRSSRFGVIYSRLPNLEMLEKMSHKGEVFGFWMLSIAIVVGVLWLPRAFSNVSYLDPKLIATLVIWTIYAVGISAKRRFGWQGRRMMILSLVAFLFVFLSMTLINMVFSTFHSFQ